MKDVGLLSTSSFQLSTPGLVVVTGATASGKTAMAVLLARELRCDVVSADSRQLYRQIPIVTAAPTTEEMQGVKHHFVGCRDIWEPYSAADWASDAYGLIERLMARDGHAVVCGGSMMYLDALLYGIDRLPVITPEVRKHVGDLLQREGLPGLRRRLATLDPWYLAEADRSNPRRMAHALEICLQAGVPYSSLRRLPERRLPWPVTELMTDRPREQLYQRIRSRVDSMLSAGLEGEMRRMYPHRHLNALQTVGCREMFDYFDGLCTLDEAAEHIARNTRVFAKKQLAWLRARHPDIIRLNGERLALNPVGI